MARLLLISNSTLHGSGYLDHVETQIRDFLKDATRIAFVPLALYDRNRATVAALGIFFPVYLIVVLLAPSYKRWAKNPQLNAFVRGVTAAATGAIAGAVIVLARRSIYDVATLIIALMSLVVLMHWKVPEPILIAFAAAAGLLLRAA